MATTKRRSQQQMLLEALQAAQDRARRAEQRLEALEKALYSSLAAVQQTEGADIEALQRFALPLVALLTPVEGAADLDEGGGDVAVSVAVALATAAAAAGIEGEEGSALLSTLSALSCVSPQSSPSASLLLANNDAAAPTVVVGRLEQKGQAALAEETHGDEQERAAARRSRLIERFLMEKREAYGDPQAVADSLELSQEQLMDLCWKLVLSLSRFKITLRSFEERLKEDVKSRVKLKNEATQARRRLLRLNKLATQQAKQLAALEEQLRRAKQEAAMSAAQAARLRMLLTQQQQHCQQQYDLGFAPDKGGRGWLCFRLSLSWKSVAVAAAALLSIGSLLSTERVKRLLASLGRYFFPDPSASATVGNMAAAAGSAPLSPAPGSPFFAQSPASSATAAHRVISAIWRQPDRIVLPVRLVQV